MASLSIFQYFRLGSVPSASHGLLCASVTYGLKNYETNARKNWGLFSRRSIRTEVVKCLRELNAARESSADKNAFYAEESVIKRQIDVYITGSDV